MFDDEYARWETAAMAQTPANRARGRVWAAVLASLLITLALGIQAYQRMGERRAAGMPVNDFARWMVQVPRFFSGQDHYVDDAFPTPPITLLFFAPYTRLSAAQAQLAWALSKWPMQVLIAWCCWRMACTAGVRPSRLAVAGFALVWIWPVLGDIQQGQTNLLMLAPLALGLMLAQEAELPEARGWKVLAAGLLLSLAICIKVTPVIFLAYFLVRRRWRLCGVMAAAMFLWLLVVPGLALGWERNLGWLREWADVMIFPYVMHGQVKYYFGQCIPSFLGRMLRHVPAFMATNRQVYINVVDWPEAMVNLITRVTLGTAGLGGLWWMRRRLPTLASRRYVLELGAVAAFMLLASERSWIPHYVSMALTLGAVAVVLSDEQETKASRRRTLVALVVAGCMMLMTTDVAKAFGGKDGAELVRAYGVGIWALLPLVWVIFRAQGTDRGDTSPAPANQLAGADVR